MSHRQSRLSDNSKILTACKSAYDWRCNAFVIAIHTNHVAASKPFKASQYGHLRKRLAQMHCQTVSSAHLSYYLIVHCQTCYKM